MRVTVLSVGHKMPAWIAQGWAEYGKRLPPEIRLELVELKPEERNSGKAVEKAKALEGERVLAAVPSGGTLLALDERGRAVTTQGLAVMLANWMRDGTARNEPDAPPPASASRRTMRTSGSQTCAV